MPDCPSRRSRGPHLWPFAAILAAACSTPAASAAPPSHPIVPGFERFYAAPDSDAAAGGELLLSELNCVICHKENGSPAQAVAPRAAPVLTAAAARVKPDYLRRFLADPHGTKPGTTMPNLLNGLPAAQRKAQVEALVHYLASVAGREPLQAFPNVGSAAAGEALFHSVGCVACHDPRQAGAAPLSTSMPLGDLATKYTLPSLAEFLRDPLHVRPSGRMPSLNLTGTEARQVASYLLGLPEVANVKYSYYEGSWNSTPKLEKLQPVATGGATTIDVSPKRRGERFGLRFEGFLQIDADGEYSFHLGSDDGSRLVIDGKPVVDNDGTHAYAVKSGRAQLSHGWHTVAIDYFEQGGDERLTAEYEGPGVKRSPMAKAMSVSKETPSAESLAIELQPSLVEQGRSLFSSLGCASCHKLTEGEQPVVSTLAARPLADLNPQAGCLSAPPAARVPHYRLSARQRASLVAALAARRAGDKPADARQQIAGTLAAFNCYACHQRDGRGGVEQGRNPLFQTTTKEMGDEGRIPPRLDGIGAKLTAGWLRKILNEGAKDRPYMHTRMPRYGTANVGHLVGLLESVDAQPPVAPIAFREPLNKVKAAGRHLVGDKAFGCVKCHSFGRFRATGIQSLDLKTMTARLRKDWFLRYMKNPQAYRPGTRMPSAWPKERSLLDDVLGGESRRQIAAVWAYLADGPRAKIPAGLVMKSMELIPIDEAILYRNFIQGAGPRAIGVGYPEGVHLAFDAQGLRLALLWQGRFIDASRHWTGRGQGYQPPAGENVLSLPEGVTFAALQADDGPWPGGDARDIGYRFRGYRLTADQRPTFLYTYGGLRIADYFKTDVASPSDPVSRTLTLEGEAPDGKLFMRAAAGGMIVPTGDGWYEIDGRWSTRLKAPAKLVVRRQNNHDELLLPVELNDGGATIVQEYKW